MKQINEKYIIIITIIMIDASNFFSVKNQKSNLNNQ